MFCSSFQLVTWFNPLSSGDLPTLPNLIKFKTKDGRKINIPREIGTCSRKFGVLLLNDKTGATVDNIIAKYHGDFEQVNFEILGLWLKQDTRPIAWETLINVLKDMDLSTLAKDIQATKFKQGKLFWISLCVYVARNVTMQVYHKFIASILKSGAKEDCEWINEWIFNVMP